MILYVFAHFQEASAFLKSIPFKQKVLPHNLQLTYFESFDESIESPKGLLIIQEGPWRAYSSLIKFLSYAEMQSLKIQEIRNFGIVGSTSLAPQFEMDSIHEIRSSYCFLNPEFPEFQSYHSSVKSPKMVDCLTVFKRITNTEEKKSYLPFAPLIDRELWGVAKAAKEFHIPWRSIKCISDILDDQTNCQLITENAAHFSQLLFDHNKTLEINNTSPAYKTNLNPIPFFHQMGFHFTFYQQNTLLNLLKSRSLDSITQSDFFHDLLLKKNLAPKQKTKLLLEHLEDLTFPEMRSISKKIQLKLQSFPQLDNLQLQVRPSDGLEFLHGKFTVHNLNQWNELLLTLSNLELHSLFQDLDGNNL